MAVAEKPSLAPADRRAGLLSHAARPLFTARLIWLLGLLMAAAFLIRVLRLDVVNLNSDEAYFVQLAHDGSYLTAAATGEPHPPLFLMLLQVWMEPAGVTQFGIRMLPLLFGTLFVPVLYQLGRLLGGRRLGVAAAFVAATNPAFIYYSKEVRDYGLVAFFGALSFTLLFMAMRKPRLLPAYILAALATLGSHYYGIALVGLQMLVLAVLLWRDGRLRPWPWLAAPACLALGFGPWLLFARSTIGNYNVGHGDPAEVWSTLVQTQESFSAGFAIQANLLPWLSAVMGALVIVGVVSLRNRLPLALLVAYAAAPVLFGALTLLHQTNFAPRYLFSAGPAFAIAAGAGLLFLARWQRLAAAAACLFLLATAGVSVRNVAFTPEFAPNGYRELTDYVGRHAAPDDVMVLDGVSQWPLYWYYGQLRTGLPQRVEFLPRENPAATEQGVAETLGGTGAWYLESDVGRYDPNKDTERLLATKGYEAFDGHFAGQRVVYFGSKAEGSPTPRDIALSSMQLQEASQPSTPVPAGRPLGVDLRWQRIAGAISPFKVSLRLEDSTGAIVAQNDSMPFDGLFDWSGWQPGQALTEHAGLVVPVGLLPGRYGVRALAYDAASGQALGPPIDVGPVSVDHSAPQRAAAAELPSLPASVSVGNVRLAALGAPTSAVAAGDRTPVVLLWTGDRTPEAAQAQISFAGQTIDHVAGADAYPSSTWNDADVVRENLILRVPPGLAAGSYPLAVNGVTVAHIQVSVSSRVFSPPAMTRTLDVRFANVAGLTGFDESLDASGLHLKVAWQALEETPTSYSAFVHVIKPDGGIAGQVDRPLGTDRWVQGEVNVASYDVPLDGPAGEYQVEVGIYDPINGSRLPASSGGDSVVLATIQR